MADWNAQIIEEFRSNDGKVGGPFEGAPLLLLHSTGARSGQERVNPMMYQAVDDAFAVFASKAGADSNPDWYHNLLAHPEATIEVGTGSGIETIDVLARELSPDEREPIWQTQKSRYPGFAEYELKTSRVIPVMRLDRR